MTKICILTLSASDNCGSLLQAYALKELLKPFGSIEIINFSSIKSHQMYDVPKLSIKLLWKCLLSKKKRLYYQNLIKDKISYNKFRSKYLNLKSNEISKINIDSIKDEYDIYVVGSDQVWNVVMRDFDESFFLGWTNKYKVAYGVSLGDGDPRKVENYPKIKNWINSFNFLSVREIRGKNILDEITNSNRTKKVLDPTLVVNKSIFINLIKEPILKNKDYIFFYSWAYNDPDTLNLVKKESERLKLPVYVIDTRKWKYDKERDYGFKLYDYGGGPLVFLNLMYYAKKVYVESFHGMIFANMFKKDFYLLDTDLNCSDIRLKELVNLINANNRIMTKYNYNQIIKDEKLINLNSVSLKHNINESLEYISNAINNYK